MQYSMCIIVHWCREPVNTNIDSQGIICTVGTWVAWDFCQVLTSVNIVLPFLFCILGGLSEFGVLHPSLCEISVPKPLPKHHLPPPPRASTPGRSIWTHVYYKIHVILYIWLYKHVVGGTFSHTPSTLWYIYRCNVIHALLYAVV